MDRWFPDAVEQAPYIEDPPLWLDQRAANHVKPCQVAWHGWRITQTANYVASHFRYHVNQEKTLNSLEPISALVHTLCILSS